MIIYECLSHYSQMEVGKCAICGADLVPRKISIYTKTRLQRLFDK